MTDHSESRVEHDSLGDVLVPAFALWGAQTQRATENFPISGRPVDPALIRALALVKGLAAQTNAELGTLPARTAEPITEAALTLASGEHADQFPIDVFQTGSGTSTNMNVNEVIAHLAGRAGIEVHPNDHVNAGQSSNDTFPTAIHVAAAVAVSEDLVPGLETLRVSLAAKAEEFADTVKSGRTHLMDATPVTLGQELGGYAATVGLAIQRLESALPRVRQLPLGGTAVGTGLNATPGFAAGVVARLSEHTGQPFTEAADHFEAQGTRDSLVELSGVLRTVAVGLTKIANDLRWLASGPSTGLAEIHLPDLQPGSSIMPGKVNPVLPEATLMVCAQVVGNDAATAWGGAAGTFELNVMMPVIAYNLLQSIHLLTSASNLLVDRCVQGITANRERCNELVELSLAMVTSLAPLIGYDAAAAIAKESVATGKTVRQICVEKQVLPPDELKAALDPYGQTLGGVHAGAGSGG